MQQEELEFIKSTLAKYISTDANANLSFELVQKEISETQMCESMARNSQKMVPELLVKDNSRLVQENQTLRKDNVELLKILKEKANGIFEILNKISEDVKSLI